MTHIAIVGGGISGLAAAHRLRALLPKAELTVLEATGRLGGKLHTVDLAGTGYDTGAEAFLARRPEAAALAAELGIDDQIVHPSPARATIRAGGRCWPIPAGTVMGVPASADAVCGVLPPEAVRRVTAEPCLPPVVLGGADITVGALLRERFPAEVVQRLVDPLLGGVYAGAADTLGLRATMPALAAALDAGEGSVLRAARSLLPPSVAGRPAAPVFGAFRDGYRSLVNRLAAASRARLRTSAVVRALARDGGGWRLTLGPANAPEPLPADAVVLAVPAPAAAKLLTGAAPAAAEALGGVELASMAVVAMALPAAVELPESSGTLIASGETHADGTPFTAKAFTFSSRKWPHLAGEHVLLRASVGRYGEAATVRRTDEELARAARADLAELTGVTAEPVQLRVTRWGGGLPQYGVGHLDAVAAAEQAVAAVPGLALAGAALHGVGVPACLATAHRAAEQLAG